MFEVKCQDGRGRGLFATQVIEPGVNILVQKKMGTKAKKDNIIFLRCLNEKKAKYSFEPKISHMYMRYRKNLLGPAVRTAQLKVQS